MATQEKSLLVLVGRVGCWSEWLLCGTCSVDLAMNVDQQWWEEGQILLSILAPGCHKTSGFFLPPAHTISSRGACWPGLSGEDYLQIHFSRSTGRLWGGVWIPLLKIQPWAVNPIYGNSGKISPRFGGEGGMLIWVIVWELEGRLSSREWRVSLPLVTEFASHWRHSLPIERTDGSFRHTPTDWKTRRTSCNFVASAVMEGLRWCANNSRTPPNQGHTRKECSNSSCRT